MSDLQILAHALDILIGLLADRGDLFEAERDYFKGLLDEILEREEAEDE